MNSRAVLILATVAVVGVSLAKPSSPAAQPTTNRVTSEEVEAFFSYLSSPDADEFLEAYREAARTFRPGSIVENYPVVLEGRLPSQIPPPLNIVRWQLERDGIDLSGLEAVALLKDDNGRIRRDIVLVVRQPHAEVVAVHIGPWHRWGAR